MSQHRFLVDSPAIVLLRTVALVAPLGLSIYAIIHFAIPVVYAVPLVLLSLYLGPWYSGLIRTLAGAATVATIADYEPAPLVRMAIIAHLDLGVGALRYMLPCAVALFAAPVLPWYYAVPVVLGSIVIGFVAAMLLAAFVSWFSSTLPQTIAAGRV